MRALLILTIFCLGLPCLANAIAGGVEKRDLNNSNQVIDSATGFAIPFAQVAVPSKRYNTVTDENGKFNLRSKITAPTIMSVKKDGYKPFSLTLQENSAEKPLVIGIEKSTPKDIVVESDMIHLGDNSFCSNSANAGDFTAMSSGAFYSKKFKVKSLRNNENAYLVIGSIIGIDTPMARELGQSNVTTAFASPPQIYVNGNKIADIKINGDAQEIKLPKSLVKQSKHNEITIRAGKNLMQTSYIDYDDIEFMNLFIEVK